MLKQIRYFLAVVDSGSFTEAAERCFISQSAISQQISALEKDFGVELMKRERRKFTLTPAGEYLYRQGHALVRQAEELRRETIRIGSDGEAQFRIGYLDGYEGTALRETLTEYTELYPELKLSLAKYSHEDLFRHISDDEIELVLSYQRRAFSSEYVNHHLMYVPCAVELPARNRLASQDVIHTDELREMPCILVARRDQQELESSFYRDVLGIGREFYFVETMDDARLSVLGGRGFLPLPNLNGAAVQDGGIRRIPVLRASGKPIQFNFCAFWKRAGTNYYIEEFVTLLHEKLNAAYGQQ